MNKQAYVDGYIAKEALDIKGRPIAAPWSREQYLRGDPVPWFPYNDKPLTPAQKANLRKQFSIKNVLKRSMTPGNLLNAVGGAGAGIATMQAMQGNTGTAAAIGAGSLGAAGLGMYLSLQRSKKDGRNQLSEIRSKKKLTEQDRLNLEVLEDFERGGEL